MYKISANIVCNNEKYWIKDSIESIVNIVDEIIYVDDSTTDGSLEIVKSLSETHRNIKIYEYKDHNLKNLGDLKNFALEKSKNDFILRWDADFIAYDDIHKLFEYCERNKNIFDGYILTGPNLSGDIYHQPIERENFGPECYLFRKQKSRFISNEKYPDYPNFDSDTKFCYPQNSELKKNFFFIHMNTLKSVERITFRKRMTEYHINNSQNGYWNWLSEISNNKTAKESEIKRTINTNIDIKKFDFNRWGQHPKILLESNSSKIFKVIEKDGKFFIDYPIQ